MSDCLDQPDPPSDSGPPSDPQPPEPPPSYPQGWECLRRMRQAAAGNASSPEGVVVLQATRRDIPVTAVLTVTITWATDVETLPGHQTVNAAIHCRNAAELDAALARDLDAEAASVETARRLATLMGPSVDFDALPGLSSMRGPYYVQQACRGCSGGGVRACTNPACRGGKAGEGGDDALHCQACGGAGVVPCEDCAGVGRFTHVHRPRLVAMVARGYDVPPDAPAAVRSLLDGLGTDQGGFDRFADLAGAGPAVLRHSGQHLFHERTGGVPVVTLSCACDGIGFEVEAAGPEDATSELPPFLDGVLMPLLTRIQGASPGDAFALAATSRVTAAVADAILAGDEPDPDAVVAAHEGCVGRAFVAQTASALTRAYRTAGLGTARRVWQRGAGALGLVLLLVAGVDMPALVADATAEAAAPPSWRTLWDVGVPVAAGLGVWLWGRRSVRRALRAALGAGAAHHPAGQGAWPAVVLGAAGMLYLGAMAAVHGGLAVDRLGDPPEPALVGGIEAPLPPPRVLSAAERIAAAQRALARLGRYDGPIDGKLGEGTRAGLASLAAVADGAEMADGPFGLAVAIASDRIGIRLHSPDLLVGPGWSNATRMRLTPDDQPRIAQAFQGAAAAPGAPREWVSGDGTRSGVLTVSGRAEDATGRQRPCVTFTHAVTTPAGRDMGVPSRACRSAGTWLLDE